VLVAFNTRNVRVFPRYRGLLAIIAFSNVLCFWLHLAVPQSTLASHRIISASMASCSLCASCDGLDLKLCGFFCRGFDSRLAWLYFFVMAFNLRFWSIGHQGFKALTFVTKSNSLRFCPCFSSFAKESFGIGDHGFGITVSDKSLRYDKLQRPVHAFLTFGSVCSSVRRPGALSRQCTVFGTSQAHYSRWIYRIHGFH